jgi:isocitrate/isopropylmalate dehydrogenase
MSLRPILVIPGDGAGEIVTAAALRVLRAVASDLTFEHSDIGAARFKRDGVAMPPELMARMRSGEFAAALFGAVGAPMEMAKAVLLDTRQPQGMDLWANVRPIRLRDLRDCPLKKVTDPSMVDMVIIRENGEGEYTDIGGKFAVDTPREMWQGTVIATRIGVERILRYAFTVARSRKKKLCVVDKSNAMPFAYGLWQKILGEIRAEYPDVAVTTLYCDIAAMQIAYHPWDFDVVVASNLFGDFLSDLASGLIGEMGIAPSANINIDTGFGLYEPVHGTAPRIPREKLNPLGAILSAEMMMRFIGRVVEADRISDAVDHCLANRLVTEDMVGGTLTCDQATDAIIEELRAAA